MYEMCIRMYVPDDIFIRGLCVFVGWHFNLYRPRRNVANVLYYYIYICARTSGYLSICMGFVRLTVSCAHTYVCIYIIYNICVCKCMFEYVQIELCGSLLCSVFDYFEKLYMYYTIARWVVFERLNQTMKIIYLYK